MSIFIQDGRQLYALFNSTSSLNVTYLALLHEGKSVFISILYQLNYGVFVIHAGRNLSKRENCSSSRYCENRISVTQVTKLSPLMADIRFSQYLHEEPVMHI